MVPYRAVHGIDEPHRLTWLPNDGTVHPSLPRGTPFGLIGTSSFYKRESFPGRGDAAYNGLDAFNTAQNDASTNWFYQGSDAGKYANSEIFAVRILAMEGNSHRSYGPNEGAQFYSHANERLRILGEIPLRKPGVTDPEGNPDTSFLAKIPSDTPFTFQTIDRDGLALNIAQTWHQVRPGEMRANCGGCHAHSQQPLAFESTAAGQPGFALTDLTALTPLLTKNGSGDTVVQNRPLAPVNVEFFRDIRPLLTRSCAGCHTAGHASQLVLNDTALVPGQNYGPPLPGDYARLALDQNAQWGFKPIINSATWRQTNASRYVRMFQSRRSLLMWKIMGRRLDGWTNADHPSESAPGNPATLPAGANANAADLDYTGTIMPPPGSGVPALSADEKMTFARWIDLGCPINSGQSTSAAAGALGWFLDDHRPTLSVASPRPNVNPGPLTEIRVGVSDANSGVKAGSLSIKADFAVNGRAAGAELASLAAPAAPGVFVITLTPALTQPSARHLTASVSDNQGNITSATVRFWIAPDRLEVHAIDGTGLPGQRFRLRYSDTRPDAPRRVRYTTDLQAPRASWPDAQILSEAWTLAGESWLEVAVPAGAGQRCYFSIER